MYNNKSLNILNKTIQLLSKYNNLYILVHDTSGILSNEQLKLNTAHRFHFSAFCNEAKSTGKGLKFCLKCKKLSLIKSIKIRDLYIGQCYLGITEIIKPVYYNDNLLCIIYISNLIKEESLENIKCNIIRRCRYTEVTPANLINKLVNCEIISSNSVDTYIDIIQIIEHTILHCDIPYNTYSCKTLSSRPAEDIKKHLLIKNIEEYITFNYNQNITLKKLSNLYYIDEQYLCKLFKKETSIGFVDYLNGIRIDNAKRLLINSNNKIGLIAYDVGYNDLSYFNKVFKKLCGCTPKEYRNHKI